MSRIAELLKERNDKGFYLCTGLDPSTEHVVHIAQISEPTERNQSRINYARSILNAALPVSAAVKAQHACWAKYPDALRSVFKNIAPETGVLKILDGKFNDIGNTSDHWADFADDVGADAVTISPYMGFDDVALPFFKRGIGVIVVCSTTNESSVDLQRQRLASDLYVDEEVARIVQKKMDDEPGSDYGLVLGATRPHDLERVRRYAPRIPLLIPGVGKQGGAASIVTKLMREHQAPWTVNVSRDIAEAMKTPKTHEEWTNAMRVSAERYASELRS